MDHLSLDALRRDAKTLKKAFGANDLGAHARAAAAMGAKRPEAHADFLHIIARERGFASWPRLKLAAETRGLDVAAREARLRNALHFGRHGHVVQLLEDDPQLGRGQIELDAALYRKDAVLKALAEDPSRATTTCHGRRPILHLAFSRWHQHRPELIPDMLEIAEHLHRHGADVNDGWPHEPGSDHLLSALYGAIGHGNNMALGQWLLDHGANPDDGESLYHATELGHHDGLRMLLAAGANPKGTNALFRAMDFDDVAAVEMLIAAGADVGDFNANEVGGEAPRVARALFQLARRGCSDAMIAAIVPHIKVLDERHEGALPYAYARVFGHDALARALADRGADTRMTDVEQTLATAPRGPVTPGALTGATLPSAYADIIRTIQHLPGRKPHVERLLELGLDADRPDSFGLTPLHIAGWEGLPDMLALFHAHGGNVEHINGYGGTLLSTVLHGAENNPAPEGRDYAATLSLVLDWGVHVPRSFLETTARDDLLEVLLDFAEAHPERIS
ncbi:ankyrin repeat domain-containing protein [Roseobacteraceae bacterium S113]